MTRPLTSLARELGKRNPFVNVHEEAFVSIVRTATILKGQVNRMLRAHKLAESSYNVLRILRGAGAEGRCSHEISEQVISEVPDMTRLIDRLQKLGLCERRRLDGDRRLVRVLITPTGLDLLATLDGAIVDLHKKQFFGIDTGRLDALLEALAAVRDAARAISPSVHERDLGADGVRVRPAHQSGRSRSSDDGRDHRRSSSKR
jgi:DNA-binding MarR family transcriptional regulator